MSNLFKPNIPLPTPQPPAKMPDPEDPAVLEARRQRLQQVSERSGRTSTILTGGDSYGAKSLGSGS